MFGKGQRLSILLGLLLIVLVPARAPEAKTPGKQFCFLGVCHRVLTLEETRRRVGKTEVLMASHYNDAKYDRFNPSNITSSGAYFFAARPDNAASPIYPDGTILLVWSADTKKAVVVRVNNAGPYYKDRKLDLSRAAAEKLGFGRRGVARVHVRILRAPTPVEARYKRGRTYPPVAGYIGSFQTMELASANAGLGGGGAPLPGVGGGVLVADAGPATEPSMVRSRKIELPVRKPFALAVLARAEQRGDRRQQPVLPFELRHQTPEPAERSSTRSLVTARGTVDRSGMPEHAAAGATGLRLPFATSEKLDAAHTRIQLVELGRTRVEPAGVNRHKTHVTGVVRAVPAAVLLSAVE